MRTDQTAVWLDARTADEVAGGSLPGAQSLQPADVSKAKDDGRLPANDHNTRIVVFGRDGAEARALALEVAKNAFHNVAYYDGAAGDLLAAASGA